MVYFVFREAKRSKGIGSGLAFLVPRKFWPIRGLHIRKRQAHRVKTSCGVGASKNNESRYAQGTIRRVLMSTFRNTIAEAAAPGET